MEKEHIHPITEALNHQQDLQKQIQAGTYSQQLPMYTETRVPNRKKKMLKNLIKSVGGESKYVVPKIQLNGYEGGEYNGKRK